MCAQFELKFDKTNCKRRHERKCATHTTQMLQLPRGINAISDSQDIVVSACTAQ